MEVTVMLFNYLTYNLVALSSEVDSAYYNNLTNKYLLKVKTSNNKKNNILQINNIPELININIKNIYKAPKYIGQKNIYKDKQINQNSIWGFIKIKNRLLPLIRLESLI